MKQLYVSSKTVSVPESKKTMRELLFSIRGSVFPVLAIDYLRSGAYFEVLSNGEAFFLGGRSTRGDWLVPKAQLDAAEAAAFLVEDGATIEFELLPDDIPDIFGKSLGVRRAEFEGTEKALGRMDRWLLRRVYARELTRGTITDESSAGRLAQYWLELATFSYLGDWR